MSAISTLPLLNRLVGPWTTPCSSSNATSMPSNGSSRDSGSDVGRRQGRQGRRQGATAAQIDGELLKRARRGQLRLFVVFGHFGGTHEDTFALMHLGRGGGVDEDAVAGLRVVVTGRVLQVKSVRLYAAYQAERRNTLLRQGGTRSVTLNDVDRCQIIRQKQMVLGQPPSGGPPAPARSPVAFG